MEMPTQSGVDLDEVYDFALELANEAGRILDDAWRARCGGGPQATHIEKESAVDLVTQTDEGQYSRQSCMHEQVTLRGWRMATMLPYAR